MDRKRIKQLQKELAELYMELGFKYIDISVFMRTNEFKKEDFWNQVFRVNDKIEEIVIEIEVLQELEDEDDEGKVIYLNNI